MADKERRSFILIARGLEDPDAHIATIWQTEWCPMARTVVLETCTGKKPRRHNAWLYDSGGGGGNLDDIAKSLKRGDIGHVEVRWLRPSVTYYHKLPAWDESKLS
jgi:hypothetical protein